MLRIVKKTNGWKFVCGLNSEVVFPLEGPSKKPLKNSEVPGECGLTKGIIANNQSFTKEVGCAV